MGGKHCTSLCFNMTDVIFTLAVLAMYLGTWPTSNNLLYSTNEHNQYKATSFHFCFRKYGHITINEACSKC